MSTMVPQSDTEILQGKRIMFVEDRQPVIDLFLEELPQLIGNPVIITRVKTLSEAVHEIGEAAPEFDLVVIDLHMPGELPSELRRYADLIGPDLNEGQALGLWLHATRKNIPYLYLTSVPEAYKSLADDAPAQAEPINKFLESPFDFPARLAGVLRNTSETTGTAPR